MREYEIDFEQAMKEAFDGAGIVHDPGTGQMLVLWIKVKRETYAECRYLHCEDMSPRLQACIDALIKKALDTPVITVNTWTPEEIAQESDGRGVTEETLRYSALALCALTCALKDYLSKKETAG